MLVVFFNSQSTGLLGLKRDSNLQVLSGQGVRLLACRTSALESGLASSGALMEEAEMSSLGELVGLMEEADRALFLG
jgi:sulfur relay (sulfurtransferase) complex TusBCD TusD component (DsrE family)